jgi:hypothetical protein
MTQSQGMQMPTFTMILIIVINYKGRLYHGTCRIISYFHTYFVIRSFYANLEMRPHFHFLEEGNNMKKKSSISALFFAGGFL